MTTQPSATPRTDVELCRYLYCTSEGDFNVAKFNGQEIVPASFARTLETELIRRGVELAARGVKIATLETELAAAKAECERLKADVTRETTVCDTACMEAQRLREENTVFRAAQKICEDCDAPTNAELARLRAEVERLKMCGIVELAAINPSVADYCKHWEARAERAELALANARCPNVVSTDEGTHHCALAESTVAALTAQLAQLNHKTT